MTQVAAGLGLLPEHRHRPALRPAQPLRPAADDRRPVAAAARPGRRRGHRGHRPGRRAARGRPRRGDDHGSPQHRHQRLRGQALRADPGQRRRAARPAAGRPLRPRHPDAAALRDPASTRSRPPRSRRPATTCARWRATSRPATPPRACCAAGCGVEENRLPTRLGAAGRPAPGRRRPMTERPTPDLTILETRVYRGANIWSYERADPPRRRPRLAGEVPHQHDPRLHRQPARDAARAARALLLPRQARRLRRAAPRGHLAGPRRRARRARPPAGRRPRHPPRQDPRRSRASPATTTSSSGTSTSRSGSRPRKLAVRLVNHLVQADPELDWDQELEAFILRAERTAFGPSTQAILDEAVSRDIPWIRLNQYSLVQLGQGVHAKRIRATMTSATSAIAVDIASDKDLTTRLLGAAGLPGAQAGVGAHRGPGRARGRADRLPGRRQAAGRQPRPRRLPRPAERGRRPRGVPDRQGAVPRAA